MIRIPRRGDVLYLAAPLTGLAVDDDGEEREIPLPVGTRLAVLHREILGNEQGFQLELGPITATGDYLAEPLFLDEGDREDQLLEVTWEAPA